MGVPLMPVPLVAIVGAAVVVLSAAAAWWEHRRRASGLPPQVLATIAAMKRRAATPEQLREAAIGAERAGHDKLARALQAEAAALAGAAGFAAVLPELSEPRGNSSPLAGVSDAQWTAYVRRSRVARPTSASADGRYGVYRLSARELHDAGWMDDVSRGTYRGKPIWLGTWAPGRSRDRFLGSVAEQTDALAELTRVHERLIRQRHADVLGRDLEGSPATLSGLLAVTRRAGMSGLSRWIETAEDRAAHPDTTDQYMRFNGMF